VTAAEIAGTLGSARRSGGWWRCCCPVHQSRGATLALRDGVRGVIVKCFAGCDPRDVLAELHRRRLTRDGNPYFSIAEAAHRPAITGDNVAARIAVARRLWNTARDARGSPVVRYLAGRGITTPVRPSLRWAPHCRHPSGIYLPAMVARVDGLNGELVGVHRTYLDRDATGVWCRRDRASLGPVGGGAVRLAPAAETLLIGEGIETCLAAMQATGMPAWAALSTSGLVALVLPPIVRTAVILSDHDVSGAGERAARSAGERLIAEGRRVRLALPDLDTDFNDLLLGRASAWVEEARNVAA
jgi:putative DNA primase/helicase